MLLMFYFFQCCYIVVWCGYFLSFDWFWFCWDFVVCLDLFCLCLFFLLYNLQLLILIFGFHVVTKLSL